jgi:hypothetical protein
MHDFPRERSKEMTRIRHFTRSSIVALVALAMAVPVAQAMPAPRSGQSGPAASAARPPYPYAGQEFRANRPVASTYGASLAVRYGVPGSATPTGAAVSTPQSGDGFEWGTAAVGIAIVVSALGVLGLTASRMRARRFAH